jgi:hypothetical protein
MKLSWQKLSAVSAIIIALPIIWSAIQRAVEISKVPKAFEDFKIEMRGQVEAINNKIDNLSTSKVAQNPTVEHGSQKQMQ